MFLNYYTNSVGRFGFKDGLCNMAFEAIDRPLINGFGSKPALLWSDYLGNETILSFEELSILSSSFANGLRKTGIERGMRVFVYLDKVPETFITILGIIKAGAIACPLFSGFGREAVIDRINDAEGSIIIISAKAIENFIEISKSTPSIFGIITVGNSNGAENVENLINVYKYDELLETVNDFKICRMHPSEPAIIHYTSGTTGKPKGAIHSHQAILGHHYSSQETFKPCKDDIFWCTADPGWITGTSHGIFGPWSCSTTQAVYCGGYDASRWCEFMNNKKVTIFYTSPTALRQLMKEKKVVLNFNFKNLKRIYSVGEPLNPEVITWAKSTFGVEVYDTWFQTETGAITITNRPGVIVKPGSIGKPHQPIKAFILNADGEETTAPCEQGELALMADFPSFFTGYWKKDDIYKSRFKNGFYLTGDRAWKDEEGYFWFVSRTDDVMKVSGHLLGPFEIENSLLKMNEIVESAVIGIPDVYLQECPMAFIVLKEGIAGDRNLEMKIKAHIRTTIAPYAVPRVIKFIDKLPKTRSGKIMRRLLKNRELGLPDGDLSTLEN